MQVNSTINLLNFTLRQLIGSDLYLGYSTCTWNVQVNYFLLGCYRKYNLFDLNFTYYILKSILKIVFKVALKKGRIWVVNESFYYFNNIDNFKNLRAYFSNLFFFNEKWKKGSFTNYKVVKEFSIKKFPHIVLFPALNSSIYVSHEARLFNIPTSGIVDSIDSPYNVMYPIPGNSKSLRSVFFFYLLIFKILSHSVCVNRSSFVKNIIAVIKQRRTELTARLFGSSVIRLFAYKFLFDHFKYSCETYMQNYHSLGFLRLSVNKRYFYFFKKLLSSFCYYRDFFCYGKSFYNERRVFLFFEKYFQADNFKQYFRIFLLKRLFLLRGVFSLFVKRLSSCNKSERLKKKCFPVKLFRSFKLVVKKIRKYGFLYRRSRNNFNKSLLSEAFFCPRYRIERNSKKRCVFLRSNAIFMPLDMFFRSNIFMDLNFLNNVRKKSQVADLFLSSILEKRNKVVMHYNSNIHVNVNRVAKTKAFNFLLKSLKSCILQKSGSKVCSFNETVFDIGELHNNSSLLFANDGICSRGDYMSFSGLNVFWFLTLSAYQLKVEKIKVLSKYNCLASFLSILLILF